MKTEAQTNLAKQLAHQRRRRNSGDTRIWFWMDAETRAVYDRLRRQWPRQKDKMMAAALKSLDELNLAKEKST